MFVNDYIINIKSYSGIRYFINNIIAIADWIYYHQGVEEDNVEIKDRKSQESPKMSLSTLFTFQISKKERNSNEQKEKNQNNFDNSIRDYNTNDYSDNIFFIRQKLIRSLYSKLNPESSNI